MSKERWFHSNWLMAYIPDHSLITRKVQERQVLETEEDKKRLPSPRLESSLSRAKVSSSRSYHGGRIQNRSQAPPRLDQDRPADPEESKTTQDTRMVGNCVHTIAIAS
ncbi:hypothetical protein PG995_011906 [Apiospora arundinis]